MRESVTRARAPATGLCAFLRENQDAIVARWVEQARGLQPARTLPDLAILDHLPVILMRIADLVDAVHTGERASLGDTPEVHAHDRLVRGFDLEHVVAEYALLRRVIFDTWEQKVGPTIDLAESRRLNTAIDQAIAETAIRFARGRERILKALDRISEASLGTSDIGRYLRLLATATLESTEAVETVVVLLREGDTLRVRAAVGLEEELETDFSVELGEGFAGRVAESGAPMLLSDAADSRFVKSPVLRRAGVRALYGVPLVHQGRVIGVAHMGTRTARNFSEDDKLLFRTMVARASSVIVQAQLVDEREQAFAREQAARDRLASQVDADRRWVQAIVENLPVGVVVAEGERGEIVLANARAFQLVGSGLERIGDADIRDLDGKPLPGADRPLSRALGGANVVADHVLAFTPAGVRTLRIHASPIHDAAGHLAAVAAIDDVTAARRAEDLQRFLADASKTLAETLSYDAAVDAIARLAVPEIADACVIDAARDGQSASEPLAVVHVDPKMAERVRELRRLYPPSADAPRGVSAVIRTGRSELYADVEALLAATTRDEKHLAPRRELGLRSVMIVPLVARGTILGAVSFASGASGRRFDEKDLAAAEDFARRAGLALDNARLLQAMQDAVRLREEVLAVVSHDLRSALNSVQLAATLLADKVVEPSMSQRVGMILRGAGRMNHLIASLLDVASIQAGRLHVDKSTHVLGDLVDEAIELAEPLASERQLQLAEEIAQPVEVACDRERILQVLSNLLGNAIKFAQASTTVVVRVDATAHEARVSVSDRGPGIAEGDRARLFEPYWSAAHHARKGTGLGLYIAKSIVEGHGGRIWAESREGEGSTFTFTLPR